MSSDNEMETNDSDYDQEYSDDNNISDEDIDNLETHEDNSRNSKNAKPNDEVLNIDSLQAEMEKTIVDVQTILQVQPGVCRILLHKYKWNKDSLLERFYENSDTHSFLVEANVIPQDGKLCTPLENNDECEICCSTSKLTGLACNHQACADCWNAYLTDKIVTGRQSEIECMASNCNLLLEDEKIMFYVNDPNVIKTYRRLIIDRYVESNKFLNWCPGIDCGKAVKTDNSEPHLVVCSCEAQFCFSCGNDWHEPVNCRHLRLWLKKCNSDSGTSDWLNVNTKDCPKCNTPIEKNGGCNRMRCSNPACLAEFCWKCLKLWSEHGTDGYRCNRFDTLATKTANNARSDLRRFHFYHERYIEHQRSLKLENKLTGIVNSKMEQLQTMSSMSWIDVQFLQKAVDVLFKCRRTIMFSFVFAYFLKSDDNDFGIFESNQNDLEMATEELSGLLERGLLKQNPNTLKQTVQDKYRYLENRCAILLEDIVRGTEQNFWEFRD